MRRALGVIQRAEQGRQGGHSAPWINADIGRVIMKAIMGKHPASTVSKLKFIYPV